MPPPPQGEIPKTTRFILERLRENTNQMNARIDQILPLPIWKTYSEPRNELGTRNDLVIFGRGLPSMFSNIPKKHPLLYAIKQVKDALKKSRILFLITTRKETRNNIVVWIIRSECFYNNWSWPFLTSPQQVCMVNDTWKDRIMARARQNLFNF